MLTTAVVEIIKQENVCIVFSTLPGTYPEVLNKQWSPLLSLSCCDFQSPLGKKAMTDWRCPFVSLEE